MTPMKQFQDHFNRLNTYLGAIANKVELSKTAPKYNRYNSDFSSSYTKGVESDFIRVYQDTKSDKLSFAFAFNNFTPDINKTEISISIKKDKTFECVHMNIATFKEKMNGYLAILGVLEKSNSLNFESAVQSLKSIFVISNEYVDPDYKGMVSNVLKNAAKLNEEVEEHQKALKTVTAQLIQESKEINDKVAAYKSKLETSPKVIKLRKQAETTQDELKKLIIKITAQIDNEFKVQLMNHKNLRRKDFKQNIVNEITSAKNKKNIDSKALSEILNLLEKM